MPIAIFRAPEARPGAWHHIPREEDGAPSGFVGYTCPRCSRTSVFDATTGYYKADAAGELANEFVCAQPDCGYSAPLRLKGWTDPPPPISSTTSSASSDHPLKDPS